MKLSPLWNTPGMLNKLIPLVYTGNGKCPAGSGMMATGIPPHVIQIAKIDRLQKTVDAQTARMDTMETNIADRVEKTMVATMEANAVASGMSYA